MNSPVPVEQGLGGKVPLADGACRLLGRPLLVCAHVHLKHAGTLRVQYNIVNYKKSRLL